MTDYQILMDKAKEVSKSAYAPYSKFFVGACVLAQSGKTYTGCNMENGSYGLAMCAERNAIGNAIANGERKLTAIAIYAPDKKDCPPCGACRQVIYEFQGDKGVDVITEGEDGLIVVKITTLLPKGFSL